MNSSSSVWHLIRRWKLKTGLHGLYQRKQSLFEWFTTCYQLQLRAILEAVMLKESKKEPTKPKMLQFSSIFPFASKCTKNNGWILKLLIAIIILFSLFNGILFFVDVTNLRERVNPHALRGYSHCPVDSSVIHNHSLKYPCNFNPKPNPKEVLIVTFINSAWLPLAHNWICSAEKVGLKDNLYLVAFEKGVCSQLSGIACYEDPSVSIKRTAFSQPEYQKLVIERTQIILKLLSCWPRVALVDADITFLQNPLEYLQRISKDKDIVFQADSSRVKFLDVLMPYIFRYICGGFIYMKSNYATKQLWLSVLQYQMNFLWNDQAGLNVCIRHPSLSIQWDTLDPEYFPNGQQYFTYDQKSSKNMIVHANHLENDAKIVRLIASKMWCADDIAARMCHRKMYASMCDSYKVVPDWCKMFAQVCQNRYHSTIFKLQ